MTDAATAWVAPGPVGPLSATVRVPGSKSATNRALVLAALADGRSTLVGPLRSRDTESMAAALRDLGVTVDSFGPPPAPDETDDRAWRVTGCPGPLQPARRRLDAGQAGTVARFLLPVAGLAAGTVVVDGADQLRRRPLRPLAAALVALGVEAVSTNGHLPVTVDGRGRVPGGPVSVDASASSQFVSGLLLAGARFDRGLDLTHVGPPLPSAPHVAMTVQMLAAHGVVVDAGPGARWTIAPGPLTPYDHRIEPDLSAAAVFLAAAAVAGGTVRVPGWPERSAQPGALLPAVLEVMGAQVRYADGALAVTGRALHGIDVDLSACGELTPVLAATAALADTPSRLRGIGHLRGHETDRLAALARAINGLGGDVREGADGLEVHPRPLHAGRWPCEDDHRMAMAGALVGLRVPGVRLDDVTTTAKTYPGFRRTWEALLGLGHAPEVDR